MNFDRLRFVAERAELGEEREAVLAVTIPERPGSFREFCKLLGKRAGHRIQLSLFRRAVAHLFVGIEVANRRETEQLLARAQAPPDRGATTCPTTRWRSSTSGIWSAGMRRRRTTRSSTASSFRSGPGALMTFLNSMSRGLEHQPLPLPQPRRRLRARAGGHAGAGLATRRKFRHSSCAWATTASRRPAIRPTGCSWGSSLARVASLIRPRARRRAGATTRKGRECPSAAAAALRKVAPPPQNPRIRAAECRFRQTLCSGQPPDPVANLSRADCGPQFAEASTGHREEETRLVGAEHACRA